MSHTFPALPYPYDALEPYIDAKTMEVHYSKHHKTYFDKFVTAVQGSDLETQSLDEIFAAVSQHSPAIRNIAQPFATMGAATTTTSFTGIACRQKAAVNHKAHLRKPSTTSLVTSKSSKTNSLKQPLIRLDLALHG